MYNLLSNIKYYEDEKIQMISLPYLNSIEYEMVIILPREEKYSSSYCYLLNENVNFTNLKSKLKVVDEVELYLPKFEFEYSKKLKEILIEMGMKIPFSNDANFSKLTNNKTKLGDVLHETYIKIDQNGTEAAAVTVINEISSSDFKENIERYYMNVNHSFIFFITSDSIKDLDGNNLLLFLGSVNNLKSSQNNLNENNEKDVNNNNENDNIDNNVNEDENKNDKTENNYDINNENNNINSNENDINNINNNIENNNENNEKIENENDNINNNNNNNKNNLNDNTNDENSNNHISDIENGNFYNKFYKVFYLTILIFIY